MADRKLVQIGMRGIIGLVVIAGFVCTVAYMVIETPSLDTQSAALIGTMLGYLSAKADSVVMWYFGGSENADRQTENIREIYRDSLVANQEGMAATIETLEKFEPGFSSYKPKPPPTPQSPQPKQPPTPGTATKS